MYYVMKHKDRKAYLTMGDKNQTSLTTSIEKAKKFEKAQAENILKNHGVKEWASLVIERYEPDITTNENDEPKLSETYKPQIHNIEQLVKDINNAQEYVVKDRLYYENQLNIIEKIKNDINHYFEFSDTYMLWHKHDLITFMSKLMKYRRKIKNKIEYLEELEKSLCPTKKFRELLTEKEYTPRYLPELFEGDNIPNFSDIFGEETMNEEGEK